MDPAAFGECAQCGQVLPGTAFRANPHASDGLNSWCKACTAEYNRGWRANNPDSARRWRENNPEAVARYNESRRQSPTEVRCSECDEVFLSKRKDALTCSPRCRARRSRRVEKPASAERRLERSRAYDRHRQSVRRTAFRESDLTRADVERVARSRKTCPGCGCRLSDEPGPRQRNVDHVIPLCAGGSHSITTSGCFVGRATWLVRRMAAILGSFRWLRRGSRRVQLH